MINNSIRAYDYYLYQDKNSYGQPALSDTVQGQTKLAIFTSSQSIQDNINYQDCSYVGLTTDKNISDKYVIQYGNEKLKVLYVNPQGRLIQVFLKKI